MRAKAKNSVDVASDSTRRERIAGNTDPYVKNHQHSLEYLKRRWFYAPVYRYTPIEQGGIRK